MKLRCLIFVVVASAGCGQPAPPPPSLPLVKIVAAGAATTAEERRYSGEVRARHETALAFRVGGKLVERTVDAGTVVQPGQVLARLDPNDLSLQLRQAEAQRLLAQAEAQRYRDLRTKNFVSQSALDTRETALAAANALADLAHNQLSYAALKADKPGVVAQVLAEPGQVVAAGQPVFRLAQSGENEVAIALPESQVAGLKLGAPAQVCLWSGEKTLRARLRELSPLADPATRTYAARVSLLETDPGLALGMTATVQFTHEADGTLLLPHAAIFQQGAQTAVWVLGDDDTLSLRNVVVSRYGDAGAAISSGLKPGERIVAAGVHKLVAGQKVHPQQ